MLTQKEIGRTKAVRSMYLRIQGLGDGRGPLRFACRRSRCHVLSKMAPNNVGCGRETSLLSRCSSEVRVVFSSLGEEFVALVTCWRIVTRPRKPARWKTAWQLPQSWRSRLVAFHARCWRKKLYVSTLCHTQVIVQVGPGGEKRVSQRRMCSRRRRQSDVRLP